MSTKSIATQIADLEALLDAQTKAREAAEADRLRARLHGELIDLGVPPDRVRHALAGLRGIKAGPDGRPLVTVSKWGAYDDDLPLAEAIEAMKDGSEDDRAWRSLFVDEPKRAAAKAPTERPTFAGDAEAAFHVAAGAVRRHFERAPTEAEKKKADALWSRAREGIRSRDLSQLLDPAELDPGDE